MCFGEKVSGRCQAIPNGIKIFLDLQKYNL